MYYVFGAYCLDTQRYELTRAGMPIPLRPKAFHVLAYLVTHHQRVVEKEDLLTQVWPGQFVGDVGLRSYIMEVRKALGDRRLPYQVIRTLHGHGYRFVAPVEVHDHAPSPAPRPAGPLPVQEGSTCMPPSPARTPTAVVEAALAESPMPQIDGEYKPISVLCCGFRTATVMAAGLDPERLYRVLQTVVGLAHEVLQAYGGTLTQLTPEGFTAVFGVPVAQEDHARHAVLAALDLQQRLAQHPTLWPPALRAGLVLRIGVHSGLGVVGELGPVAHRQVTVVGAPAQGALQLQQQAAPGALLVSATTYHLVQGEVRGEPCGSLVLEGWPAPLPVYTVQGLVRRYAGVPRRLFRSESPFVGRQREVALLHDHLAMVRAGAGQVLTLLGPPGIGKSRLLSEWRRQLPPAQVTWYAGQCLAYGQTTPYLSVRDLVQQVCALDAGDSLETRTAAVQRRLAQLGQVSEEDVALLLQVLDLPVAPEALGRLRPEARQARTCTLLWHLLRQEAQQRPLVLVVEDVHWIDPTSEAWLTALVDQLAGTAVLLLLTQRPGYQAPWGAHAAATQLALPPLRAEDSQAVVAAVPGMAHLPAAQSQQLVTHGAGNPFFLEELAWHAVAHGRSPTPVALPETVHAVVAARLDRLAAPEKALLQTAAVIGPEVPVPLLQALTALPEAALHQGLAHLQAAAFLSETLLFPEHVYTFKHALTQDVAYSSLLLERRRVLHARIVAAVEQLYADRLTEHAEQLAQHAVRGEVWAKAVVYCRQAGTKALARGAFREVVGCFEQALTSLRHLPASRATQEQAIDLRLDLRGVLLELGDLRPMLAHLREAATLAEALGDPPRRGRVAAFMCRYLREMGDHDRAVTAGQQALAVAETRGDVALRVMARQFLGVAYYARGDHRRARVVLRRNVEELAGERIRESFGLVGYPAVNSRAWFVRCLAELGAFPEGIAQGAAAARIAEAVEHPPSLLHAYLGVGFLALRTGDLATAIPVLERSLALCREYHILLWLPETAAALGYAYAWTGRVSEAFPLLEQAEQRGAALATMGGQSLRVGYVSEAYLRAGRMQEAVHLAGRALALARAHQERGYQAWALRLLGEIAAQQESVASEPAAQYYRQALALAEELGMRPLVAHCHRGLGTLYAKTDQREQARTALATAIALYRTMEMAFWLPQTEAALAQVEGESPMV